MRDNEKKHTMWLKHTINQPNWYISSTRRQKLDLFLELGLLEFESFPRLEIETWNKELVIILSIVKRGLFSYDAVILGFFLEKKHAISSKLTHASVSITFYVQCLQEKPSISTPGTYIPLTHQITENSIGLLNYQKI